MNGKRDEFLRRYIRIAKLMNALNVGGIDIVDTEADKPRRLEILITQGIHISDELSCNLMNGKRDESRQGNIRITE